MRQVSWRFAVLGLLAATIGCSPSLIDLVEKQDSPGVKAALAAGANPNQVDRNGNTALALAALGGNINIIMNLLDAGADPNSGLYEAASSCNGVVMKEFLRRGADPNLPNPNEKRRKKCPTPLFVASGQTYPGDDGSSVVQALVDSGADVNRQNDGGFTPLYLAVYSGSQFETAYALLIAGADPRLGPPDGANILNVPHCWSFAPDRLLRSRVLQCAANGPDRNTAEIWLKMRLLLIEKGYLDEDPDKVIPDADPMPEKKPADGEQAK